MDFKLNVNPKAVCHQTEAQKMMKIWGKLAFPANAKGHDSKGGRLGKLMDHLGAEVRMCLKGVLAGRKM